MVYISYRSQSSHFTVHLINDIVMAALAGNDLKTNPSVLTREDNVSLLRAAS